MTPTRWTWWWFAACAIAVMGGLGWASYQAIGFERRELQAQADARLQESVRLTLWRMESALAPIIARESSRPYFEYKSFYPSDRAYTNMLSDFAPGEVLVPSPLLRTPEEPVLLHFEVDDVRGIVSPQVPTDTVPLATDTFATAYEIAAAEAKLRALRVALEPARPADPAPALALDKAGSDSAASRSFGSVQPPGAGGSTRDGADLRIGIPQQAANGDAQPELAPSRTLAEAESQLKVEAGNSQVSQNLAEYVQRSRTKDAYNRPTRVEAKLPEPPVESGAAPAASTGATREPASGTHDAQDRSGELGTGGGNGDVALKRKEQAFARFDEEKPGNAGAPDPVYRQLTAATPEKVVVQGELVAKWIGPSDSGMLVLTREVSVGEKQWTQGFWLDWPRLRDRLIEAGGGLIPGATLVPAGDVNFADPASLGRRLAGIPAELVVPVQAPVKISAWSPLRTTLVMTWVAALGGVIAIGLVLRTSTELAERRGRFVSAVTHELRTPLTTFCMYSQMLSEGIVKDPEAQQSYFNTLRTESQRLARIVESVLDYARLGRRKPGNGKVVMRVGELVDQCVGALAARCEQAGMELVVQRDGDADQPMTTDPATVERVLFNLVDNACKYAAGAADKRVHLEIRVSVREVELYVRDHGPGIERAERGRIFRPFVRGKKEVEGTVSGLGLGLALAKGLSEQLGGELKLASAEAGAAFSLKLPLGT